MGDDGSADLQYVLAVAKSIGKIKYENLEQGVTYQVAKINNRIFS